MFAMYHIVANILGVCGMLVAIVVGLFAIGIVGWTAIMKLVDWMDETLHGQK